MTIQHDLADARLFALQHHGDQTYGDGVPYSVHLFAVEVVLRRFGFHEVEFLQAAWLHDVLEDTDADPAQVLAMFGQRVFDMVSAVTEPKWVDGAKPNRKTRHAMTYPRIVANPDAVILKLADRIANVESGGKREMYAKEHAAFKAALAYDKTTCHRGYAMGIHLDLLFT